MFYRTSDAEQMVSSDKNIAVFAKQCASEKCAESCESVECELCRTCLSAQDITDLHTAYREHIHRGDTKRIFPAPMVQGSAKENVEKLSKKNKMMVRWFEGKCAMESSWCS